MRLITSIGVLFVMLWLSSPAHSAAIPSAAEPSMAKDHSESTILCLNGKASTELVDVSMSTVYDWVHAGQQGIHLTITNKTDQNVVISWDNSLYPRNTAGAVYREEIRPLADSGGRDLHEVVAPKAVFSKTLWPSSSAPKAGRLENRKVFLAFMSENGGELSQELILDISRQNRICSR